MYKISSSRLLVATCVFSIALLSVLTVSAQERHYKELFPVGLQLSPNAWHMGVGVTRMFGSLGGQHQIFRQNGDSTYSSENYTRGKIGMYLEGGYSRLYKNNTLFDRLDITLGLKQIRADHNHKATLILSGREWGHDTLTYAGEGYFDHTSLNLAVTGNKHIQLNATKYLHFGYGLEFDYRVFNTTYYDPDNSLQQHRLPVAFRTRVHLQAGYGFFWRKRTLINPIVRLPVLSANEAFATKFHASRYLETILTIRITWLKSPEALECPPIRPSSREKAKKKDYLQELFHPDDRRNPVPNPHQDDNSG